MREPQFPNIVLVRIAPNDTEPGSEEPRTFGTYITEPTVWYRGRDFYSLDECVSWTADTLGVPLDDPRLEIDWAALN